jgi:hypothetical protein
MLSINLPGLLSLLRRQGKANGVRKRHVNLSEDELRELYRRRLELQDEFEKQRQKLLRLRHFL